ncbi:MAG: hypothetical protein Q7S21_02470 [archaeon]|nr:hypothetical protein [archaeon]
MGFTEQQIIEATKYIETMKALDDWTPHINLKSLAAKGLSKEQIKAAKIFIEGAQTFEGAPHVLQEHLAVFDCANKCGIGERFIAPMGHIKIMAAVQPFISGAISKTVNIPNSATVDDIKNIYVDAWKLGLKCVALYRDGCKSSQPLSTSSSDRVEEKEAKVIAAYSGLKRGEKKELAYKRHGYTTRTMIGGNKVFVRTGEYPDGTLGEIFLDMHKEGAAFRGLLGCFSIAISYGLQYGVPLEKYVDAFTFTRFEPSGRTDHPYVKSSTSIVDFVFRVIALDYLGRTDLAHVKPEVLADTAGIKLDYATIKKEFKEPKPKEVSSADALNKQMGSLMGDAPPCDNCGHITVRNGSCYKCLNCGSSMGCS